MVFVSIMYYNTEMLQGGEGGRVADMTSTSFKQAYGKGMGGGGRG